MEAIFSQGATWRRQRAMGTKLHPERFNLDIRKKYFTMRTIVHWSNLPMVESPLLVVFKMRLDRALHNLI